MKTKPCGRPIAGGDCTYPRAKGLQRCRWHWLEKQSAEVQAGWAGARLAKAPDPHRPKVPKEEWPDGERWCAGCQSFVPLFYVSGSRCRSCSSTAAHRSRVKSLYGLEDGEYEQLLKFQGGVCYVCRRTPRTIRLAVDHDHRTGEVRGLLCANNENGCNRGVIANLEAAKDGGIAAARRALEYLEHTPYERMKGAPRVERVVNGLREPGIPPMQPPPF